MDDELEATKRLCEAVGQTGLAAELWSSAVAASEAWSEYRRIADRVQGLALAVGITDEQWEAIKRGD